MVVMENMEFRTFNPRMALYSKGLNYNKQGAIFFACKNYFTLLNEDEQKRFDELLKECCSYKGDMCCACFEFLTSEITAKDVCKEYKVSVHKFYQIIDDFYLNFSYVKKVY